MAVCYLRADARIPDWATRGEFYSVTRTREHLSVVCSFEDVPDGVTNEGPWSALEVQGPLDFALTGILASMAGPLADAGISIFALSTYLTDYILVREHDLDAAVRTLRDEGHIGI